MMNCKIQRAEGIKRIYGEVNGGKTTLRNEHQGTENSLYKYKVDGDVGVIF